MLPPGGDFQHGALQIHLVFPTKWLWKGRRFYGAGPGIQLPAFSPLAQGLPLAIAVYSVPEHGRAEVPRIYGSLSPRAALSQGLREFMVRPPPRPPFPCPLLAGHILHCLPESPAGLSLGCPQRSPSQLHALGRLPFPFLCYSHSLLVFPHFPEHFLHSNPCLRVCLWGDPT